ncbi:sensor histidine kinase [Candidatus Caldatribacterium saccharofermentans]|uniref:sensor histidine kinase n=1 Tax=Candidatus Caldatribacterium saccharofermentans TaxID=1454753 RepID=UPI003CFF8CE5
MNPLELFLLGVLGIAAFFLGYALALLKGRPFAELLGVAPEKSPREDLKQSVEETQKHKEALFRDFLALLDRVSAGGALYLRDRHRLLLNTTFAQAIGLRSDGVREVAFFEIPVFGDVLAQAVSSGERVSVPSSGFAFLPFLLGEERFLLLEDEKKKDQRLRSLRYFLTALWHEVQTPLTVLSGYLETLEEGRPMEGEILSRMVRQIRRLEGTIREIQRLSVLLGEKPERISDREFSALLQEVLEKAREDRKDLRVRIDIAEKEGTGLLPLSRGEAFVLLSNLITNAFSFNVPGGEVAITVAFGESELRLTLENTTSPPDAEFLRWFFDPTEALPRGGSGKGVGLYLIREVVERGNGTIHLRPQRDRVVFEITIPWETEGGKISEGETPPR